MDATESLLMVLDNDRASYESLLALAGEAIEAAPTCEQVESGIWSIPQARTFLLADSIKEFVENAVDDVQAENKVGTLIAVQMIQYTLGQVEWHDVANHYLATLAEQSSHA